MTSNLAPQPDPAASAAVAAIAAEAAEEHAALAAQVRPADRPQLCLFWRAFAASCLTRLSNQSLTRARVESLHARAHALLPPQVASLQARLAASQGRVEELLDEKADLEYDLDVMDRKVELLREEVRGRGAD